MISRHHPPGGWTARSKGYGGHSVGETPGPIPNPEAKTHSADGTAPGRVWESRSPPEHHSRSRNPNHVGGPPAFNDENDAQPPTDQSVGERRRETLGIPLAGRLFRDVHIVRLYVTG